MSSFSDFQSAFARCNTAKVAEVVAASRSGYGLPDGVYTCKLIGGTPDTYDDEDGNTWPKVVVDFEVVTADDARLVGVKTKEFWELGPKFDDGSSPDAATIKKMYKKAFGENMPEDEDGFPQALSRLFSDALGTNWKYTRKTKANKKSGKEFTNTVIGGIVNI